LYFVFCILGLNFGLGLKTSKRCFTSVWRLDFGFWSLDFGFWSLGSKTFFRKNQITNPRNVCNSRTNGQGANTKLSFQTASFRTVPFAAGTRLPRHSAGRRSGLGLKRIVECFGARVTRGRPCDPPRMPPELLAIPNHASISWTALGEKIAVPTAASRCSATLNCALLAAIPAHDSARFEFPDVLVKALGRLVELLEYVKW